MAMVLILKSQRELGILIGNFMICLFGTNTNAMEPLSLEALSIAQRHVLGYNMPMEYLKKYIPTWRNWQKFRRVANVV